MEPKQQLTYSTPAPSYASWENRVGRSGCSEPKRHKFLHHARRVDRVEEDDLRIRSKGAPFYTPLQLSPTHSFLPDVRECIRDAAFRAGKFEVTRPFRAENKLVRQSAGRVACRAPRARHPRRAPSSATDAIQGPTRGSCHAASAVPRAAMPPTQRGRRGRRVGRAKEKARGSSHPPREQAARAAPALALARGAWRPASSL